MAVYDELYEFIPEKDSFVVVLFSVRVADNIFFAGLFFGYKQYLVDKLLI